VNGGTVRIIKPVVRTATSQTEIGIAAIKTANTSQRRRNENREESAV
jgi:hypothetical protein